MFSNTFSQKENDYFYQDQLAVYHHYCQMKSNEQKTFQEASEGKSESGPKTTSVCSIDTDRRMPHAFHKQFNQLKERLPINDTRKTHVDSLLKKCKSKYVKAVHEGIKKCLNLRVERLPQNFITNIKIDFNKIYLEKTIGEIYTEFNLLPKTEEIIRLNLIRKGKQALFEELSSTKFKVGYQLYLQSDLYSQDFEYVANKEGEETSQLYDYIAKNMCDYYLFNRGNRQKSIKYKKKKVFVVKKIEK